MKFLGSVFQVPVSLGTVAAREQEMSAALAAPHDEARRAVHSAAAKNVDETSWKQAGRKCWLWAAATATVAFFVIYTRRNFAGLQALLGATIQGIVCSDRWSAYNRLPLHRRQICWAHLKRDFQKSANGGRIAPISNEPWSRSGRNSKRLWSKVVPARIRRRPRSAPMSWRCIRRYGYSRGS